MSTLLTRAFIAGAVAITLGGCGSASREREESLKGANQLLAQKDVSARVMGGHVAIAASEDFRGSVESVNSYLTGQSRERCKTTPIRDEKGKQIGSRVVDCAPAFGVK